nr:unnamed protein product [Callosobruchus analis]
MKHFPKDPERRRQWLIKTRRDNWTPTDHSCLCEVSTHSNIKYRYDHGVHFMFIITSRQ